MSAVPKMTPWFVNGEVPWEPGVYNVSCQRDGQTGKWWGLYDGRKWRCGMYETPEDAAGNSDTCVSAAITGGSWRGLAEKPE